MFKKKPIYSVKERFVKDVKKASPGDWKAIGITWAIIIYALWPSPVHSLTQQEKVEKLMTEPVLEDYSSEIGGVSFGLKLQSFLSRNTKPWVLPQKIFFTSYNPEVGQTDSSPCIGANGTNVCEMAKQGIRTIALSQDMVGRAEWKEYHYGDRVQLHSDNPQCNGVFQIEDTMNARYTDRGDIFCLDRSCNTSCWAAITRV